MDLSCQFFGILLRAAFNALDHPYELAVKMSLVLHWLNRVNISWGVPQSSVPGLVIFLVVYAPAWNNHLCA